MITEQKPLPSGLGFHTTAAEVLGGRDLSGKIAIVTGGYSGLGTETTRVLSEAGATVIVPVRPNEASRAKARESLKGMKNVEIKDLELLDPASINAFAALFMASGRPVHMLIQSAGIMAAPLTRDARGYEVQFAANHLGHYQLTAKLWPSLVKAGGARVVAVSSRGHRFAGVNFDDPNFNSRAYDKWGAYGQSKTANALFAMGLDKRGKDAGVRAFSVHPGGIMTDLSRHLSAADLKAFGVDVNADGKYVLPEKMPAGLKTVPEGAATQVWCAASSQLDGKGGVYCEDCDIAPMATEDPKGWTGTPSAQNGMFAWACDPAQAERLWEMSEKMTGVKLAA